MLSLRGWAQVLWPVTSMLKNGRSVMFQTKILLKNIRTHKRTIDYTNMHPRIPNNAFNEYATQAEK